MDLISGWSDDKYVYLAERVEGRVRVRRFPAKWSAFFTGLDDADRLALQRSREVVGLSIQGEHTRVEFRDRWTRRDIVERLTAGARQHQIPLEILEADVNPLRRFLSDYGQVQISSDLRVAWFDLETDSRCSFVQATEKGLARILCWSVTTLVDGDARLVATGLLEADHDAAERALIEALLEAVKDFDVLLAWSGSGFDFPVLEKRAQHVKARVNGKMPEWHRWSFLDALEVFKKYHAHVHESGTEKTSYKLDSIAQAVLGEGKHKFEAARTWEAWVAGGPARRQLLEYNVQDSLLMPKIEAKTGYVALHLAVCVVTRCFPDDRSLMASQQGDGFLLRLGYDHGHFWPTKRHTDEIERYAGAFVMEPTKTGIIGNVHVADFASLYPSIIRSWNISPETVASATDPEPPGGVCRLPYETQVRFIRGVRGMFPLALDELVSRRAVYSKRQDEAEPGSPEWERYKRLSGAYKIVANSFYGIMGSPFARFYNAQAAEAVTQTGAWLIKHVGAVSGKYGLDAFYGDSVTGDRVVVLRDPRGYTRLIPIEELWAMFAHEGVTASGKDYAEPIGWHALARDATGVEGWFRLCKVLKHVVSKPTWRLTTKHGQTEVTTDHGIMVDGREMGPEEFVRSDARFTCVRAPLESQLGRIDLLDWVGDFVYQSPYRGSVVERRFVEWPEDRQWLVLSDGNRTREPVRVRRFYHTGTDEWRALLRLVAAYASDGSASLLGVTTRSRSMLSFCKADLAWQQQLAADLRLVSTAEVFGPHWSDTTYVVRSGTATMASMFAALGGVGSFNKRLPSFFFHLDQQSYEEVVRALEKGDGSVEECGALSFTSTSQQLIAGVSYLLSQRDVSHGFSFREDKHAWTLRTRCTPERDGRYSIKSQVSDNQEPVAVYDLEVEGAHTFVDGVGRVLLHNTDSVFVTGDGDMFTKVVAKLNGTWKPMLDRLSAQQCHLKLEFEKSFSRIVLVSAKRYIGRFSRYKGKAASGAKIEVKGLEYKRGDTLALARDMQKELIDILMGDVEPTVEVCREFVAKWRERVLVGELTIDEIVLSQSVKALDEYSLRYTSARCQGGKGKNRCTYVFATGTTVLSGRLQKCPSCGTERKVTTQPAHVRVARMLADRGEEIRPGTRVEYLIVSKAGEKIVAVPARDPGAIEKIDRGYYWLTRIYSPTQRLLEAAFPEEDWAEVKKRASRKKSAVQTFVEANI